MNFINTPLTILNSGASVNLDRRIKDIKAVIDNLLELIIFTPKGGFLADPDFGFEYWNHEYTNINYKNFNNGQAIISSDGSRHEITKAECQDSIRNSLSIYVPLLTHVSINMELSSTFEGGYWNQDIKSKHTAKIVVEGSIENELGTFIPYKKEILFFTEPTLKKRR